MKRILLVLTLLFGFLSYSQGIPTELNNIRITQIQEMSDADSIAVVSSGKVIGYMKISELKTRLNIIDDPGVGDMLKSVYDTNNNGIVDNAEIAQSVSWSNVTSKPSFGSVAFSNSYLDLDDRPTVTDGQDGNRILSGSGAPSSGLGNNDDFYIDIINYDFYGPKTNGVWGSGISLQGPSGQDGTDGTDGTDGLNGTPGIDGQDGIGVPSGGDPGQVLAKVNSTDYETEWIDPASGSVIDSQIQSGSSNPVQNNAIYNALNTKANDNEVVKSVNSITPDGFGNVDIDDTDDQQLSLVDKTLSITDGGSVDLTDITSWGSFEGTLSDQTDLNTALNNKANLSGINNEFTNENTFNNGLNVGEDGVLDSNNEIVFENNDKPITATGGSKSTLYSNSDGDLVWLKENGRSLIFKNNNTAGREVEFQDGSGVVAYLDDIPDDKIYIDGNYFRYVGSDPENIQIGDIASGGIYTYQSTSFYGDLICIDNTGDLSTGIGTKWKPFNLKEIN
ncbi:hypothetical protein [Galbibacter sp. BG1]